MEGVILRGNPKYEILEWAKGQAIDNVVISRRSGGVRGSADGSNSEGDRSGDEAEAPEEAEGLGGVSDYLVAKLPANVIVVK